MPFLFYSSYGLLLSVYNGNLSYHSIKQILFYLIPGIVSILMYGLLREKTFSKIVDIQFGAICIVYMLLTYSKQSILFFGESHLAFIFGIYTLFFLYKKKYKYFLISLIFTILANKRIALVSLIICIILIIFVKALKKSNKARLMGLVNILTLIFIYMYIYFISNSKISELFSSFGVETQGRLDVWDIFVSKYEFNVTYIGQGIGYITENLNKLNINGFSLLHNDILAAYIELGFWGFGIWLILHQVVVNHVKNKNYNDAYFLNILYIYTFINYTTDNISIYINFLLPFYMIVLLVTNKKH